MNIQNIPLHLIDPHPAQPREKLTGIDSLADSIAECGVRQPIVVRVSPFDSSRYQIEAGHRRTAAAAKAGLTEIPAVVFVDDDEMSVLALLATQSQHVPFTEKEAQKGLQGVLSFGNVERTGKALGLDPAKIRSAQKGYSLIDKSKIGQATFDELVIIAEFEDDPALQELEKHVGKNDFTYVAGNLRAKKKKREELEALIALGMPVLASVPAQGSNGTNYCENMIDAQGQAIDIETCKACPAVCVGPRYSGNDINYSHVLYCDTSKSVEGHHYKYGKAETEEERQEREAIAKARQERRDAQDTAKQVRLAFMLQRIDTSSTLDFIARIALSNGLKSEYHSPALVSQKGDSSLEKLMVLAVNEAEDKLGVFVNYSRYDEWAAKIYGPAVKVYRDHLKHMGYEFSPIEEEILSWLEKPKKEKPVEVDTDLPANACPACEGDGRPFAKDGSRNGNAKCEVCGGTGTIAPGSDTEDLGSPDPSKGCGDCVYSDNHGMDCSIESEDERPDGCPNAPIACDEACEQNDLDGIGCTLTETDTVPEVCPKQGNLYAGEIKMLIARTNGNGTASTKYTAPFDTKHVTYSLELSDGLATLCIFDEPDLDTAKADAAAVAKELGIDFGSPKVADGSDTVFEAAIA